MVRRFLVITEHEGADGLALLVAEIMLGRTAPEHLSIEEGLAALDALDTEMGQRARQAGTIIHDMIVQAVAGALAQQQEPTKH